MEEKVEQEKQLQRSGSAVSDWGSYYAKLKVMLECSVCEEAIYPIPTQFCQKNGHILCSACMDHYRTTVNQSPLFCPFDRCEEKDKVCGSLLIGMECGIPRYLDMMMKTLDFHCSARSQGCTFVANGCEAMLNHELNLCDFRDLMSCNVDTDGVRCGLKVTNPHDMLKHLMTAHAIDIVFPDKVSVNVYFKEGIQFDESWKPALRSLMSYSFEKGLDRFCLLTAFENATHIRIWLSEVNPRASEKIPYKLTIPYFAGNITKAAYEFYSELLPFGAAQFSVADELAMYFEVNKKVMTKYLQAESDGRRYFKIHFEFGKNFASVNTDN